MSAEIAVFCANADVGAFGSLQRNAKVYIGDAYHNVAPGILYQGGNLVDQGFGLFRRFVHFPVAGNDGLAKLFIHVATSFLFYFYREFR